MLLPHGLMGVVVATFTHGLLTRPIFLFRDDVYCAVHIKLETELTLWAAAMSWSRLKVLSNEKVSLHK